MGKSDINETETSSKMSYPISYPLLQHCLLGLRAYVEIYAYYSQWAGTHLQLSFALYKIDSRNEYISWIIEQSLSTQYIS